MQATDVLEHEHEIILLVLGAAEQEVKSIAAGGKVNAERVGKMLDLFQNFVDKCHHAKEEKHLFVMLEQRGLPRDKGPVSVVLQEHEQGRRRVRAVADALDRAAKGDPDAARAVKENLWVYLKLLREHIKKENEVLFPMINKRLRPDDQEELELAFEQVEAEEMGEGVHEKYHALAHELAGE